MTAHLYVPKLSALVCVMVAEAHAFLPPKNPAPQKQDHNVFGNADFITKTASWAPTFGLVSWRWT